MPIAPFFRFQGEWDMRFFTEAPIILVLSSRPKSYHSLLSFMINFHLRTYLFSAFLVIGSSPLSAADWPMWR